MTYKFILSDEIFDETQNNEKLEYKLDNAHLIIYNNDIEGILADLEFNQTCIKSALNDFRHFCCKHGVFSVQIFPEIV